MVVTIQYDNLRRGSPGNKRFSIMATGRRIGKQLGRVALVALPRRRLENFVNPIIYSLAHRVKGELRLPSVFAASAHIADAEDHNFFSEMT